MKNITLIIGKNSNLTIELQKKINNSIVISARELFRNESILDEFKNNKIKIIFNNFQPASSLKSLDNCHDYISSSIGVTAMVLDKLKNSVIDKIIYTSSSSVYGENNLCSEEDNLNPLNLHAALKVANEKLIEKFCIQNNIDYTITRIFNMYGGNDNFSIISKLMKAYKDGSILTLINDGNSIRDFIHINDVVAIYIKLLNVKKLSKLNIGTGVGVSIKYIIDYLSIKNISIKTKNINSEEIKTSISSIKKLNKLIWKKKFINILEFVVKELYK
jgi:nucleoside-diphosphate-sugar epimerase